VNAGDPQEASDRIVAVGASAATTQALSVMERAQEAGVRLVRFLWCGNDGTIRAKATTLARLPGRLENGIGGTVAMQLMNGLDQPQAVAEPGPIGEVRLIPDPETFRILPYAPRTGALIGDHVFRGNPLQQDYWTIDLPEPICQRTFLKRMASRLAERDSRLRVGFENEFTLATRREDRYVPIDRALCFSTIGLTASQEYADELVAALDAQSIELDQLYAESGTGQQKICLVHRSALRAADEQIFVRETIRGVGAAFGLVASLAPRPWLENDVGNSCHMHFSLSSGDRSNRFHSPGAPDSLSGEARGFLAGVLEHLPGLIGLTAPSFNSFPQPWAGAVPSWSHGNRSTPLRVPSSSGTAEGSTHAELKAVDASCNPYLAIGGLIAAGMDGLVRGLLLPEPDESAVPSEPSDEEAGPDETEHPRLPQSQKEALDALEADQVLMEAMGASLAQSYLAVRRSEWEAYSAGNATFVQHGHFQKY
jgi:glutamine synthetase